VINLNTVLVVVFQENFLKKNESKLKLNNKENIHKNDLENHSGAENFGFKLGQILYLIAPIVLFILFTSIQWFLIVAYSFTYIRQGPSGFIAFFGLLALLISYISVKKIIKK
jgi:hypothetical protein